VVVIIAASGALIIPIIRYLINRQDFIIIKLTLIPVWDEIVSMNYIVLVDYNDPQGRNLRRLFQLDIGVHCREDFITYPGGQSYYAIFPLTPHIIDPDDREF
jgi:hypothetical protein